MERELQPLPKNPTRALGLLPFGLDPNEQSWTRPWLQAAEVGKLSVHAPRTARSYASRYQ